MDPAHMPEHIRTRKYIEYNYADFIRQAAPDVAIVTTSGTRGFFLGDSNLITSGNHSVEKVIVRGAEPEYIEAIPLFSIAEGRFISAFDQEHARSVVVLGAAISESLFPGIDAIGKTVRITMAASRACFSAQASTSSPSSHSATSRSSTLRRKS